MPSRLLSLGSPGPEGQCLRLVPILPGDKTPYAALSYCWGGDQAYKTTRANHRRYEEVGISAKALAPFRTIVDAIHVAHILGISFLWIDSLCIIQDDPDDQGREIGKMQHIYAGAYLTISAACATTSRDGFLDVLRDDDGHSPDFALRYPCMNGTTGTVILTHDNMHYYTGREPIDTRAWTLQEHCLSSRVLAFERHKVRWLCQSGTLQDGGRRDDFGDPLLPLHKLVSLDPSELCQEWETCVKRYTHRMLTLQADKLPAMAGIAARFAQASLQGGSYLAGIWEVHIAEQLCWATSQWFGASSRSVRRIEAGGTPSWSWASISGPIEFPYYPDSATTISKLELTNFEHELVSEDAPFGAVRWARLAVLACAREATWTQEGGLMAAEGSVRVQSGINFHCDTAEDADFIKSQGGRVSCLEAHTYSVVPSSGWLDVISVGIVVIRIEDEGKTYYRRVGRFNVFQSVNTFVAVKSDDEAQMFDWQGMYWFADKHPEVFVLV